MSVKNFEEEYGIIEIRIVYKVRGYDSITIVYRINEREFLDIILKYLELDTKVIDIIKKDFEKIEVRRVWTSKK